MPKSTLRSMNSNKNKLNSEINLIFLFQYKRKLEVIIFELKIIT